MGMPHAVTAKAKHTAGDTKSNRLGEVETSAADHSQNPDAQRLSSITWCLAHWSI